MTEAINKEFETSEYYSSSNKSASIQSYKKSEVIKNKRLIIFHNSKKIKSEKTLKKLKIIYKQQI